ncbi:MAG: FecR domain-containing protein [bacterium]|nr:FecR domain-containing protein [bacterium]
MFRHFKERAFTLVELAVVIGIVILLTAVVYAVILSPGDQSRQNACDFNLKAINAAIKMYYNDKGCSPSSLTELAEYGVDARSLECPTGHCYDDLYLNRDIYRNSGSAVYSLAYFVGCPWHGKPNRPDKNKAVVMLLDGSTVKADVCQAVISNVSGNVRVLRRDDYRQDQDEAWNWSNRAQAAANNMKLLPADRIQTATAASADLAFADSSRLNICQETRLTILQSFKAGKAGIPSGYHSAVRIEDDTDDPQVVYSRDSSLPQTYFEIATPALIAGVRGTTLRVYKYLIEVTQAAKPVELFDKFSRRTESVEAGQGAGLTADGKMVKEDIGGSELEKVKKVKRGKGWKHNKKN